MLLVSYLLGATIAAAAPLHSSWPNPLHSRANAPQITKQFAYFASLGDSFASGSGAGDSYADSASASGRQCSRNFLAYPEWLFHAGDFDTPHEDNGVHFAACADSSYKDVSDQQVAQINSGVGLVTLSVGASDAAIFGPLTACIFGFDEPSNPCANSHGNQTAYLAHLQALGTGIYAPDAQSNYFSMMDGLHRKLALNEKSGTSVYQTAYPQLFDDYTDQCDDISFSYPGTTLSGQKLTRDLRQQLNFLIQQVNVLQQYWIDQLNHNYDAFYPIDWVRAANQDQSFNGHRFCRAGITEPDRDNAETYFFNLLSQREGGSFPPGHSNHMPSASVHAVDDNTGTAAQFSNIDVDTCSYQGNSDDLTDNLECLTARAIKNGYSGKMPNLGSGENDAFAKTLHPKQFGHALAGKEVLSRSQYVNGSTNFGVPLRILPVGDSITAGFKSTSGGGYREFLYNILRINNKDVAFIGAQQTATNSSWGRCDGYYGDKSLEIRDNLSKHGSLKQNPNVVIIMAGTNDVGKTKADSFADLLPGATQLEGMINDVFQANPDAAVLVGHIISRGLNTFDAQVSFLELLSIQWNANINMMVNRLKTQHPEWRLRYVHTTPTTFDHEDPLHPNDRGYMKLAADFAEGLSELAQERPFVAPGSTT